MTLVHFYLDEIRERDFAIEAVELLSAPYEQAWIYCLNYGPLSTLLGPIAQRKIVAASNVKTSKKRWLTLPLLVGSLQLSKANSSVIAFSQGHLLCNEKIKYYYFFSPYWESPEYDEFFKHQSLLKQWWLKLHEKRSLERLRKYSSKVICASKYLAEKYQLQQAQVVYPFFKSEEFPRVDLIVEKKSITIYLEGSTDSEKVVLAEWMKNFSEEWQFYLFGSESDARFFRSSDKVRFEHQFCSATLHAAFLQSALFFQFRHPLELTLALSALASGVQVAHLPSLLIDEVIPEGLRVCCENFNEFMSLSCELSLRNMITSFDIGESRRFALRFSEKNFKDKMLKIISC